MPANDELNGIARPLWSAFVLHGDRGRVEGSVLVGSLSQTRRQRLNALPVTQLAFAGLLESRSIAIQC